MFCSRLGLSTAQWSVTTAVKSSEMPTRMTENVSLTFRGLLSSMALRAPGGARWGFREGSWSPGASERLEMSAPGPRAAAGPCQEAPSAQLSFRPRPTRVVLDSHARPGRRSLLRLQPPLVQAGAEISWLAACPEIGINKMINFSARL